MHLCVKAAMFLSAFEWSLYIFTERQRYVTYNIFCILFVFRNTTVDLSHIDTSPNMTNWPLFHNGVAAGLRIADFSQVDSSWIIYNQPKNSELTNEYAGFLMALGLNRHLVKMHNLNKHDYLSKVRQRLFTNVLNIKV